MSEPRIFWYERKELHDPVAVVGFPSIGLVGSILTSYLARELKLDVVGGMTLTDTQQYTLIREGVPYPPVRIYAGSLPRAKRKKTQTSEGMSEVPAEKTEKPRPRGRARDLIIVTSELAPKPEQTYEFTLYVLGVLREMGAREIIFVDGFARMDGTMTTMAAYSNNQAKKMLEEAGIRTLDEGLVRGMSGVGLYQGRIDGTDTVCILAPANPQMPDPRAAAEALETLKKVLPRLNVTPDPLVHEAEDIEARIRAQQNQQSAVTQNIYG